MAISVMVFGQLAELTGGHTLHVEDAADTDDLVRFLKESTVEAIHATLAGGMRWTGAGWNTTKASRVLENATGVGLVSSKLTDNMQAFLFS